MAIDILNIQPTTISRDLKGKYLCLYGQRRHLGGLAVMLSSSLPKRGNSIWTIPC